MNGGQVASFEGFDTIFGFGRPPGLDALQTTIIETILQHVDQFRPFCGIQLDDLTLNGCKTHFGIINRTIAPVKHRVCHADGDYASPTFSETERGVGVLIIG